MQTLATRILNVLADGLFHSGDALGVQFGVSKTSIWKTIGGLAELGLDVHSVRGKGYRLSERLCLLNEASIRNAITPELLP
jgi:BirA family biotin operon repressor/biotin-[acetyl-CoA-carboxylase] ligase